MQHSAMNQPRVSARCVFLSCSALIAMIAGTASPVRAQAQLNVLFSFPNPSNVGYYPEAPLLADSTGPSGALRALYGTNSAVFKLEPPKGGNDTWTAQPLWNKPSEKSGFGLGFGAMVSPSKRITPNIAIFGTTSFGGVMNRACGEVYDNTCGTVFTITGHKHEIIYRFTGGIDGGEPYFGPTVDANGNLYVATWFAGGTSGCGTVDKLSPPDAGGKKWTEQTLWTFSGGADGCEPGELFLDRSGVLYGTANEGGSGNNGSVFALIPPAQGHTAWTEQTLWDFQGGTDGSVPLGQFAVGKDGTLYGATFAGGSAGDGVIFSLTPSRKKTAWREQVIWSFRGGADGAGPWGSLLLDKAGVLFGTADAGGNATGNGTVFSLAPPSGGQSTWNETTLWQFSGPDGSDPEAGLTVDKTGVLYGTTYQGGTENTGTVFRVQNSGFVP